MVDKSDIELVNDALMGRQSGYTMLVDRYQKSLTLFVAEYLDSIKAKNSSACIAEEPQDLVQETFHKAFINLSMYKPEYQFSTWLFAIAKNLIIDYSRKRSVPIVESHIAEIKNSPEDKLISYQEAKSLIDKINSLEEPYRRVAQLRFIYEYAYIEIAQELGLTINTVKTRIKRAKEKLVSK